MLELIKKKLQYENEQIIFHWFTSYHLFVIYTKTAVVNNFASNKELYLEKKII